MKHKYAYQNTLWDKRKRLGLTQSDLAEDLKVSHRTIQRIERGVKLPNRKEAQLIAEHLLLDFDTFWKQCEQAWDDVG